MAVFKENILKVLKKDVNGVKDGKLIFILLFAVLLVSSFIAGVGFKVVNDGFWHIKTGEYIVQHKAVPRYDIFSWYGMSKHFKWVNHEWLFGVIAYLIYSIDGFFSASIFMGIITTITAVLVFIYSKLRSKSNWLSLLIAYVYCINSGMILAYRPSTVSIPIILLVCIALENKKYVLGLVFVILGINIHGGIYPIYIIVFAYYTLFKNFKYFIAALLCILVNPYSYDIYLLTIKLLHNNGEVTKYILEWRPTQIYTYKSLFAVVVFTVFTYIHSKMKLRDLLLSGSFLALSLTAERQIIFLYFIILPIISPYIMESFEEFSKRYLNNKLIYYISAKIKKDKNKLITVPFIVIIQLVLVVYTINLDNKFFINKMTLFSLNKAEYPIDAVDYINKHPEIKNSHLLNHYNDSQYLIFRGIPTFIDSRCDLFTYNFNKTYVFYHYMFAFQELKDQENLFKMYDIDYLLLNKSLPLNRYLREYDFLSTEYSDNNYIIYKVNKDKLKAEH